MIERKKNCNYCYNLLLHFPPFQEKNMIKKQHLSVLIIWAAWQMYKQQVGDNATQKCGLLTGISCS